MREPQQRAPQPLAPSEGVGGRGKRWRSSWPLLAFALAVAILIVHRESWRFVCDDAFISFRYARNWVEGGELAFNLQPLERVEGYTNFLWVGLIAVGLRLGIAAPFLAESLALLASAAILGLAAALLRAQRARKGGGDRWCASDLLPGVFLLGWPEFVVWASGGLETSFAVALGMGAWLAGWRARWRTAALLAAAAVLTRPDSGLWLGLAIATSLGGRGTRRPPITALAIFALPVLSHLLWRHAYYGAWLPNTWYVKSSGGLLRDTWGLAYIQAWASNLALVYLLPLVLLLRRRHVRWVAPLAGTIAYAWWVGGDFMAYSRFLLPATVCLALLVSDLLTGEGLAWLGRGGGRWTPRVIATALLLLWAGRIPERIEADRARNHLEGRWESVQAMDRFAQLRLAAGRAMREVLPADTWVSVGAAGAMPFASALPAFDSYGLVDPGVLDVAKPRTGKHARPGHQLHAPLDYVLAREPELLCHLGSDGVNKPSRREARRRGGAGARWACFDTGPIPDRRAEGGTLAAHQYCCLQPASSALIAPRRSGERWRRKGEAS